MEFRAKDAFVKLRFFDSSSEPLKGQQVFGPSSSCCQFWQSFKCRFRDWRAKLEVRRARHRWHRRQKRYLADVGRFGVENEYPDTQRSYYDDDEEETILTTQILRERYADNAAQQEALRTNKREDPVQLALLEDERLALWFQNEEFVNQLKRDQDFIKTLESEESFNSNHSTTSTSQQLPTHLQYVSHDDDAVFKEKLKHMGKVSKRKVVTMARMFFKKKNGQQPILDEEDDDISEVSPSPDIRRLR